MSLLLFSRREIRCKIVYYGPGLCGKTTNLQYIHSKIPSNVKGKMISVDTKGDKTLFFDFLPLDLGKVAGLSIRIELYTVPGQVHYNSTRKLVLRGFDGVVFVADSLKVRRKHNIESLQNLEENLEEYNLNIHDIPLVMQYNKRDLEGRGIPILAVQDLEGDLNAKLQVPSFPASAVEGYGVFDTLRAISKWVAKEVSRRILGRPKAASAL
jgi:signal recognition particle receptor subunit beta